MRVLLVGYGRIGREMYMDYAKRLRDDDLFVVDKRVRVPPGREWDGRKVDIAVFAVDTPGLPGSGTYDYGDLSSALAEYAYLADFLLVRSTVSLDFLDLPVYRRLSEKIGLNPEFYGTTRDNHRTSIAMGFSLFTPNVPRWFVSATREERCIYSPPEELIVAKLADSAFLATKVTFFHSLYVLAKKYDLSFELIREMVTLDPRVVPYHSYVYENLGWESHCLSKDVPAFAALGFDLAIAVMALNEDLLSLGE